jgi:RNA polymerase sigma factor (sigma-70 family)
VNIEDATLWKNFKSGDESAFALIFRTHYEAMFNYGLKFQKDKDLVEDMIQELFLELWKNRQHLSDTDKIKPYLFTAIRRKILSKQNHQSKIKKLFSKDLPKEYAFEIVLSPETELIDSQAKEKVSHQLKTALEALPPRQKEILYLLFYQDLSYEEIANVMEMNYQSARNLVHRAVTQLREKSLLKNF